MQYRRLGRAGLKVSAIGVGANQFGGKVSAKEVANILDAAREAGVNFIDTADVYQGGKSEETIGAAVSGYRDRILVATKVRHSLEPKGPNDGGTSRHHIIQGVEASLKRLQTDYIDLYQIHSWDEVAPTDETMRALDDLVRAGKVRYIGASNYTAWQLTHANAVAEIAGWECFVSIQPHYHMFELGIEKELIPACEYFDIGILPYFPLAGGFLTGKYEQGKEAPEDSRGASSPYVQRYMIDDNYAVLDKLAAFANERDHTLNELAHAWLLAQPQVSSVISGATKVEHVVANAQAGDWELGAEEAEAVTAILDGEEEE